MIEPSSPFPITANASRSQSASLSGTRGKERPRLSPRTQFLYTIPPTAAQVYDMASPRVFPSVSTLVGKLELPMLRFFAHVSSRARNTSRSLSCDIGGIRWVTYCLGRSPLGALFCRLVAFGFVFKKKKSFQLRVCCFMILLLCGFLG